MQLSPLLKFRELEKKKRYRNPALWVKISVLLLLCAVPFLFPSYKSVDLAMKIILFGTLTASFDILLGYTGILSFGHVMFFGIGAYAVGLFTCKFGDPGPLNLILAFLTGTALSLLLALIISILSLRVKTIFFAMITLALAEFAIILATRLSSITGGEDGISIMLTGFLSPAFAMELWPGFELTGRTLRYLLILGICTLLFLAMIRLTHSPFGKVLQAIRDNRDRAEALGYRTFQYQTVSICLGCMSASITGGLYAIWVGYVNPESVLGIPIMLDILLMVIIGGLGTLYGSIVGAAFLEFTYTYLPDLQKIARDLLPGATLLHGAMERWLLMVGVLFILVVFFFPKGIVGTLQKSPGGQN